MTRLACAILALTLLSGALRAAPAVRTEGSSTIVEAADYRMTFVRESLDMTLELRSQSGQWQPVTRKPGGMGLAYISGTEVQTSQGLRATWALAEGPEAVVVGLETVPDASGQRVVRVHCLCTDDGVLMGSELTGDAADATLWSPPRIALDPQAWDRYAFWDQAGAVHQGAVPDLQPYPAYAGVSPWGRQGDTAERLDAQHPALLIASQELGIGLGVVFVDYDGVWEGASAFLQRHTADALYLYAGTSPAQAGVTRWAWLAPFAPGPGLADGDRVAGLVAAGERLTEGFAPVALPVPEEWLTPLPDFPVELRRSQPVADINDAIIYTVGENARGEYGIDLARKVGTDAIVRGWFKWAQAPPVQQWTHVPPKAHEIGALFGGGITCSALYDSENGLSREQVLDMATRGPDGELVDAWDTPGIRHGSLSSPAYLDYLFRWCKEQIDAGVDYLFMDEHTAALSGEEGFDDHSLADFRRYLLDVSPRTADWDAGDPRWTDEFGILLQPPQCPSGAMDSFSYRAYLRDNGLLAQPAVPDNRLLSEWGAFRSWRDDVAWKALTDRIRAYAAEKGRRVLISANGLARYVDLQVLGVWGQWTLQDGHVDLSENQLPHWRSLVRQGCDLAGREVPVVLFHDWGFGEVPFPWLAVPPSEREVWMRTRGAEIYAAGARFAFPVLGPFGCDAGRDGTLATIARQAIFYKCHSDLYRPAEWLSCESLSADRDKVSLSATWQPQHQAVIVHAINRDAQDGELVPCQGLRVRLPLDEVPTQARALSPDFEGQQPVSCTRTDGSIELRLPAFEAYAVAALQYGKPVDVSRLRDPVRIWPSMRWARPMRERFIVRPDGSAEHEGDLEGFLQGMLHTHLRNPPTFVVSAKGPVELVVHVRAVASAGARLQVSVDGDVVGTVDLPDLDGKNDGNAAEYDRDCGFAIPAGEHEVKVDNVGADWAVVSWYQFRGELGE